jgi:hypothetical protein
MKAALNELWGELPEQFGPYAAAIDGVTIAAVSVLSMNLLLTLDTERRSLSVVRFEPDGRKELVARDYGDVGLKAAIVESLTGLRGVTPDQDV